ASEVRIQFHLEPPAFTLAIEDNGRGFAPGQPAGAGSNRDADNGAREQVESTEPAGAAVRLASGNGLVNMRRRLEEIGGRCLVESVVGRGTTVRFVVVLGIQDIPF